MVIIHVVVQVNIRDWTELRYLFPVVRESDGADLLVDLVLDRLQIILRLAKAARQMLQFLDNLVEPQKRNALRKLVLH